MKINNFVIISIIITFFINLPFSMTGSIINDTIKPKVALVLSGGSAKGLAHIGVIQYLEEIGIKPDLIVGTSMGAIVGAMYSIGYSVDEMKEVAVRTDWLKYLSNDTDLRNLNIEEKDNYENYMYSFPILRGKPELKKGFIYGQEMELNLNKITFPAVEYENFDSFPIQFRAISTNVLDGTEYIFTGGPLGTALRASMSLPTLFYPVKYEDKLLIDGGVSDNFGIEIAIKEGADIIIGSNVGNDIYGEKELSSFQRISSQLIMFNSKKKVQKYKDFIDILIEPPVTHMGTRFDKALDIIQSGYDEAAKWEDELEDLKKCIGKQEKFTPVYKAHQLLHTVNISDIQIDGIKNNLIRNELLHYFKNAIGNNAGPTKIEKAISPLYGTGYYNKISYLIRKSGENKYKLSFEFLEAESNVLKLGINYNTQANIGVLVGYTSVNKYLPPSKLGLLVRLSAYPGVEEYFTKYIPGKIKNGFKQSISYVYDKIPIYNNSDDKSNVFVRNMLLSSVSYQIVPSKSSLFDLGYHFEFKNMSRIYNSFTLNIQKANTIKNSVYVSFYKNTLDKKFFPNTGSILKVKLSYTFDNYMSIKMDDNKSLYPKIKPYPSLEANWQNYVKLNKRFIWSAETYAEYANPGYENEFILFENSMGGAVTDNYKQIRFYGLPNNYLISSKKLIFTSTLHYKLYNKLGIMGAINYGFTNDWKEYFGSCLGLELDSPLGPIQVGLSSSVNYSKVLFHFNIGFFR